MKFNPFEWSEFAPGRVVPCDSGAITVRLSEPGALYVIAGGVEALAGYGTSFDLEISGSFEWCVEASGACRVFRRDDAQIGFKPSGKILTNADRMVTQSGSYDEVQKALRLFKLEQMGVMNEMRARTRELKAAQSAFVASEAEPVVSEPEVSDEET